MGLDFFKFFDFDDWTDPVVIEDEWDICYDYAGFLNFFFYFMGFKKIIFMGLDFFKFFDFDDWTDPVVIEDEWDICYDYAGVFFSFYFLWDCFLFLFIFIFLYVHKLYGYLHVHGSFSSHALVLVQKE